MIRGIHHVAVHVHDLDRMAKFYQDAFGFERAGEEFGWKDNALIAQIIDVPKSAARGVTLSAGGCYLELFEYSAPEPESARPLRPYDKGYTHFCVDVTDIEQEYERLCKLGMTFGHPHPLDAGAVKTIYGRDPEGNIIELQQATPEYPLSLNRLKTPGHVTRA